MNMGDSIAKYRKEKHITQEQLGEAVGVTNRTVSKWEAGVSLPRVDLIPSVASALGISLDHIFGIEKPKDNADTAQIIKELVSSSIEECLPDILEDALSELLPKYLVPLNKKDEYSLLIIGRDKSTVCSFYGQGYVIGPTTFNKQPFSYCISVLTQGGNALFGGYKSKEEAAKDLKRIVEAYSAQLATIEL